MSSLGPSVVGALAAFLGNCLIGISQFLQKLALNKLRDEQKSTPRSEKKKKKKKKKKKEKEKEKKKKTRNWMLHWCKLA